MAGDFACGWAACRAAIGERVAGLAAASSSDRAAYLAAAGDDDLLPRPILAVLRCWHAAGGGVRRAG